MICCIGNVTQWDQSTKCHPMGSVNQMSPNGISQPNVTQWDQSTKCHPMGSVNQMSPNGISQPKLITALPTARIPSVLNHAFSLHTWKLYFYKTHFETSTSICAYILPSVSHFQPISARRFTHFNRSSCSLLPQFILPKMSVKCHAM